MNEITWKDIIFAKHSKAVNGGLPNNDKNFIGKSVFGWYFYTELSKD